MKVRRAVQQDILEINLLNLQGFKGNKHDAESWIQCWFNSYPLYQYFIAEENGVMAYIGWQIHGGFYRDVPVVELEQLAVLPVHQGKGIASTLVEESMKEVIDWIRMENPHAKEVSIIVWGYSDNLAAMKVYLKSFTDGVVGTRLQYDNRVESMLRRKVQI